MKELNLPNTLTIFRILALPFCAYALFKNGGEDDSWRIIAFTLFFIVGLSDILVANRETLDRMVEELLENETLNKEEIERIFKKVKKVKPRAAWTGSQQRVPSNLPPVALKAAKLKTTDDEKIVKKTSAKRSEKDPSKDVNE